MAEGASEIQRGSAQQMSPPKPKQGHLGPSTVSGKTQYLVLYNLISLILWLSVFLRVLIVVVFTGGNGLLHAFGNDHNAASTAKTTANNVLANIYPSTSSVLTWTQTLAVLEILHAAFGLVRTGIVTTSMQVASRLLLIWGILSPFGLDLLEEGRARKVANATGLAGLLDKWGIGARLGLQEPVQRNQAAFAGLLIAWTVTECVRYTYFVYVLGNKGNGEAIPKSLVWLRYNTFFALYPLGISCECWLIYQAIPFAKQLDERYALFLWGVLAIYIPGSYILYSHMMAQRRRTIKGKGKQKPRME